MSRPFEFCAGTSSLNLVDTVASRAGEPSELLQSPDDLDKWFRLAGIDYEPDKPTQLLVNCVFRNCLFEDNAGHGMFVRAHDTITAKSPPISIRFENCISRMTKPGTGGDSGMCVRVPGDQGVIARSGRRSRLRGILLPRMLHRGD